MTPTQIRDAAEEIITGDMPISSPFQRFQWQPIRGGSINDAYRIEAPIHILRNRTLASPGQPSQWFCKINTVKRFPGMFEKESRGLALLESRGGIRTPHVIGYTIAGDHQALVLEWIEEDEIEEEDPQMQPDRAKIDLFWSSFGESVARMHRVNGDSFGLEEDNYMGALPQSNTLSDQWIDFFIRQRLEPQVRLAVDKSLLAPPVTRSFERLYKDLPAIFPEEPPCLLHGDLWSGNFLRGPGGQAVLIDPAVYFGHRSMDLAMTTLFGGFDRRFYESYNHHFPLPGNYREQWAICNLYPLLIHLNLFGPGYLGEIRESLKRFG